MWLPEEERAYLRVVGSVLRLRADEHGSGASLEYGSLPAVLIGGYLRVMPGVGAWLQAAIGKQLEQLLQESERGLNILSDAMDAYLSLPADAKAEVDRDVQRGDSLALSDHVHVVELLSARGAALCSGCEALLEAVLAVMAAVPNGMRLLCDEILESTQPLGPEDRPCEGSGENASSEASQQPLVAVPAESGDGRKLCQRMLLGMLLSRAVVCPEAFGVTRTRHAATPLVPRLDAC
jgi:hypothetical protein